MKILLSLIVVATLLLAACSTAEPISTEVSLGAVELAATPVATEAEAPILTEEASNAGEGESLSDVLEQQTQTPDSGVGVKQPQPEVRWDSSPLALIVSATNCCGMVPEFVKINYIPEAQIWGDGRIIWSQFGPDNQRIVLEGSLTQEQMASVLQRAEEAGFFGWEELYTDPQSPSDLPSQCLYIQLEGESRRVCEYYQGAPQEFHAILDELKTGLGTTGQEYVPSEGYLVSYPINTSGEVTSQPELPDWDATSLEVSLSQAASGVWVEGPALEQAWKLVNETPFATTVQEEDSLYQISLQIPGLSFVEPPAK